MDYEAEEGKSVWSGNAREGEPHSVVLDVASAVIRMPLFLVPFAPGI